NRELAAQLVSEKEKLQSEKEKLERDPVADMNLQAKCAKDANEYYRREYAPLPEGFMLIDLTNNYNRQTNTCLVEVRRMYQVLLGVGRHDRTVFMDVYNVYSNVREGQFVAHEITQDGKKEEGEVQRCTIQGQTCHSLDEYNRLSWKLMGFDQK